MAHHDLARDEACQAQMINVLGPVKPMQLVTMAASANEVVLCKGCRTRSVHNSGESSVGISLPQI